MAEKSESNVKLISNFFGKKAGQNLKEFMEEFKELSDSDKEQLASGIKDGSLTY